MASKDKEPRMVGGGTMIIAPRPEMAKEKERIVMKPLSKEQKAQRMQDKAVADSQGPFKKPTRFSF